MFDFHEQLNDRPFRDRLNFFNDLSLSTLKDIYFLPFFVCGVVLFLITLCNVEAQGRQWRWRRGWFS